MRFRLYHHSLLGMLALRGRCWFQQLFRCASFFADALFTVRMTIGIMFVQVLTYVESFAAYHTDVWFIARMTLLMIGEVFQGYKTT